MEVNYRGCGAWIGCWFFAIGFAFLETMRECLNARMRECLNA